jgi:hypothetical protein
MTKNRHVTNYSRNDESRFRLTNIIKILSLNYARLGNKLATLRLQSS